MRQLLVLAFVMVGCGSPGSVTGTLLGKSLHVADAIAAQTGSGMFIAIADVGGLCDDAKADVQRGNSSVLTFNTGAVTAGTYDVSATPATTSGEAQFAEYDASCGSPDGESASSGSIIFTKVSLSEFDGTFDLTFGSDHVTGSFNAPMCNVTLGQTSPTCK